jgi:hypothetical protein
MVCLIAVGLLGCSDARTMNLLPVQPVRGEIYVGGKPAQGAMIAFHPTRKSTTGQSNGPALTSRAVAGADGKFSLCTYAKDDGVPEGDYIMTIYWPERPLDPNGESGDLPPDRLRGRFSSQSSILRVNIEKRPVTLARIDLKDQAVLKAGTFLLKEEGT